MDRTRGRVLVGTSGWTYENWRGTFFPRELPARRRLEFLASRMPTVEINGTFYSLGRPPAFERWRAQVPPGFVFAVKASRYITHMLKLSGGAAPLANFFAQGVLLLGEQLGPILWQLPNTLGFHRERALPFLDALPRDVKAAEKLAQRHDSRLEGRAALRAPDGRDRPIRYALEPRHPSWFEPEVHAELAARDIALVSAETAGLHPYTTVRTASFAYVRLHGSKELYKSRYTDRELATWARRIRAWRSRGSDVYVYFDNTDKMHAPADALRLQALLANAPAGRAAPVRGR